MTTEIDAIIIGTPFHAHPLTVERRIHALYFAAKAHIDTSMPCSK